MNNRIERLFEHIGREKKSIDCVFISRSTFPDINFFYFSNASGGLLMAHF